MILTSSNEAELVLGLKHKYVLSSNKDSPVVYLVHGRAGNFDVMWTFRKVISESCSIISVQAPLNDEIGGFSWWDIRSTDAKTDQLSGAETLRNFIRTSINYYNLKPSKTIAIGFSQGGATLSILSQNSPELLSAVAILAGFVIKVDHNEILSDNYPKMFIAHGEEDEIVPIEKAKKGVLYLEEKGFSVLFTSDNVGHKVGVSAMRELKEWINTI